MVKVYPNLILGNVGKFPDIFSGTPLASVKASVKLTPEQLVDFKKWRSQVLRAIRQRRHSLLIHNSLQNTIGLFHQGLGFQVAYEVPFYTGRGFSIERKVFDVVARKMDKTIIVEVKTSIDARDLGQAYGYSNVLELANTKADLYLGADILTWDKLLLGTNRENIKELMQREQMGVMLADKYCLVVCRNFQQLTGEEMPVIFRSRMKVE